MSTTFIVSILKVVRNLKNKTKHTSKLLQACFLLPPTSVYLYSIGLAGVLAKYNEKILQSPFYYASLSVMVIRHGRCSGIVIIMHFAPICHGKRLACWNFCFSFICSSSPGEIFLWIPNVSDWLDETTWDSEQWSSTILCFDSSDNKMQSCGLQSVNFVGLKLE